MSQMSLCTVSSLINRVVVVKSVIKTVVIMVIKIERISGGNETWGDYRIS